MLIDVPKVVAEAAAVTLANPYELLFHHTYDGSVWAQILAEWGGKEAKPKYEPQTHGPACPPPLLANDESWTASGQTGPCVCGSYLGFVSRGW